MYITTAAKLRHDAKFPREVLHLAALLGITPEFAAQQELETRLAIFKALQRALAVERNRGASKDHLYDINRHMNLCRALDDELAALTRRAAEMSLADLTFVHSVIDQIAA